MSIDAPDPAIALSVLFGEDLTPNGDLVERLDAVIAEAQSCRDILQELRAAVSSYDNYLMERREKAHAESTAEPPRVHADLASVPPVFDGSGKNNC